MRARIRALAITWLVLLVLLAIEFGGSFLPIPRAWRPLLLVLALLMVATTMVMYMNVRRGPTIVRGFAVAGLFWLIVLLGLGSLDAMTRHDYFTGTAIHGP